MTQIDKNFGRTTVQKLIILLEEP